MSWFEVAFWFHIRPPMMSLGVAGVFAALSLILLVLGIVFFGRASRVSDKYQTRLRNRLGSWFLSWGVLGFVWVFLAYERINFFGARFWLLIGGMLALVWIGFIGRYAKKTIPALSAAARARAEFEKYLPKKKI